jgi:nucleotide-binding universal stress UspA family protein
VSENTPSPGAKTRVIVAEDESLIRIDIVEILRDHGFDVVGEAADGEKAVALAKVLGARITGFHVALDVDSTVRAYLPEAAYISGDYKEQAETAAKKQCAQIQQVCDKAGVPCKTHFVISEFVADEIVKAAKDHHCDLIAIASHGRRGLARVMLGSETQKVLSQAEIPVLVMR